jgi:hypothetical protein
MHCTVGLTPSVASTHCTAWTQIIPLHWCQFDIIYCQSHASAILTGSNRLLGRISPGLLLHSVSSNTIQEGHYIDFTIVSAQEEWFMKN